MIDYYIVNTYNYYANKICGKKRRSNFSPDSTKIELVNATIDDLFLYVF